MSCGENINVGVIDRDARGYGVLNLAAAKRRAEEAFKALRVRAASPLVTVGSLSGGNQQKVLLSRWLEIGPKVLILDEPTRGVDIGAKSEIYRIIDELAKKGIGVIVISSELPEIIGTCDRVLVMREGHIEGEVGGPERQADHAGEHHGAGGRRGGLSGGNRNKGRRRWRRRRPHGGRGFGRCRPVGPAGADARA